MKQHITIDQLNELSLEARLKLGKWLFSPPNTFNNELPLLSIGQMIEFLLEQDSGYFSIDTLPVHSPLDFEMVLILVTDDRKTFRKPELADALWEAVKNVLI